MLLQFILQVLCISLTQGSENHETTTTSTATEGMSTVYDITAHLVGGSTDSKGAWGRLELTVNGERGAVYVGSWTSSESMVACRNLGYSNVISTMARTQYDLGDSITFSTPSRTYLHMKCYGNEEMLLECDLARWETIMFSYGGFNVILYCFIKESALQVVQVSSGEHRLRSELIGDIRIGILQTHCGESLNCFKNAEYRVAEANAHVLCKTARKPFALIKKLSWWDDVETAKISFSYVCSGHEAHIMDCPYTYIRYTDYSIVNCTEEMTIAVDMGHMSAVINEQEYAIGDLDWNDAAAAVACRSQGIKGAATIVTSVDNHWELARLISQKLVCQGNEMNLFECTEFGALIQTESFHTYDSISASCGGEIPEVELTIKSATATVGRLQALVDGMLGCVCDYGWNEMAASVACNMIGKESGQVIALLDASAQGLGEIEEYEFTWVRYTYCKGDEKHLWDCLGDVYPYEASPCPDDHLAGIVCDVTKTGIQISLAGGSHAGEGRVVVSIDGVAGSIGWQDWDDKDARVVCHMLGFTNSSAVSSPKTDYGSTKGPLYFDNVPCNGEEDHILDCFKGKLGWTTKKPSVTNQLVAGVICTAGPLTEGTSSDRTTLLASVGVLAALLIGFIVGMIVLVILYCRRQRNRETESASNIPPQLEMVNKSRAELKEERESEMYEDLDELQKRDQARRPYASLGTKPH